MQVRRQLVGASVGAEENSSQHLDVDLLQHAGTHAEQRQSWGGRRRRGFGWVEDAGNAVVDAGETVADTGETAGGAIVDAGETAGDAIVDAGNTVGSGVEDAAGDTWRGANNLVTKTIPSGLESAAKDVGSGALKLSRPVVVAATDLGGAIAKVVKINTPNVDLNKLGETIASKANELGSEIAKVGPIAAGLAADTWEAIKDLVACLDLSSMMCEFLLGSVCSCSGSSSVSLSTSPLSLGVTCELNRGEFGKNWATSTSPDSSFLTGLFTSGPQKGSVKSGKRANETAPLKKMSTKAPEWSCDSELSVNLQGDIEWTPVIDIKVDVDQGTLTIKLDVDITASLAALISAEAHCSATLDRRLPQKPIKKLACAGYFCLLIMLQGVATIDVKGSIAGSAELSLSADFGVSSTIEVKLASGEADVQVSSTKLRYQEGWQLAGSFDGSVSASMGPHLVVFPIPGVPVDILPTVTVEVAAHGSLMYPGFEKAPPVAGFKFSKRDLTKDLKVQASHQVSSTPQIAYEYIGTGFCKAGYYTGWVAHDATSLSTCADKCSADPKCKFFSWLEGTTCSRYSSEAGDCTDLEQDTSYMAFRKVGPSSPITGYEYMGEGLCKAGYYAGWVAQDATSLSTCADKCSAEPDCKFFSWLEGLTCSRYSDQAGNCSDLEQDSSYRAFCKAEVAVGQALLQHVAEEEGQASRQQAGSESCAGAEISVYANTHISSLGLPPSFALDTEEFEEMLLSAVTEGATRLLSVMSGAQCFGPVGKAATDAVNVAAGLASDVVEAAIPDLALSLDSPIKPLFDQDVFCMTLKSVGDCDALTCA